MVDCCVPDMFSGKAVDIAAAAATRCYFARDKTVNPDYVAAANDFFHALCFLDHHRLVGKMDSHTFDIHCVCSGISVQQAVGYPVLDLLHSLRQTVQSILDRHIFDNVEFSLNDCHCSRQTYVCARFLNHSESVPPSTKPDSLYFTATSLRISELWEVFVSWVQRLALNVAFEVAVPSWSFDLRLDLFRFVEPFLEPFCAVGQPIVLRHVDKTPEEVGRTDLLVRVTDPGIFTRQMWKLETSKMARATLMVESLIWSSISCMASLHELLQCSAKYRHRFFWDGYSSSLGHTPDIVTLSRLTSFTAVELEAVINNLRKFLKDRKIKKFTVACASCATHATLTVSTAAAGMNCIGGMNSQVILSRTLMTMLSYHQIAQFFEAAKKPCSFIILHSPGMPPLTRLSMMTKVVRPVMARVTRVYMQHPKDKTREVRLFLEGDKSSTLTSVFKKHV
jgi:hypothetical protein